MIRLAWRQFRAQGTFGAAGLALVAILVAISGPHLVHLYDTTVGTCTAHGDCPLVTRNFLGEDSTLRNWLGVLVIALPGVIGIFWGAPLVARELEAGTHRLVWTQSVTRSRWLASRLVVNSLASIAMAGLLSLLVTWWASPLDRAKASVFSTFDQRDIVPIGFAAFALTVGVLAGLLIRRTVPAMAATLVTFVAVRLAVSHWIRPHLFSPMTRVLGLTSETAGFGQANGGPFTFLPNSLSLPNAWIYSTQIVDKAGNALTRGFVARACRSLIASAQDGGGGAAGSGSASPHPAPPAAQAQLQSCFATVGAKYHEVVSYEPGSRFWTLQWCELAIYLAAALVLVGTCIWWIRRRLT